MNLKLFKKRLAALYSCWRKDLKELWADSEILVIFTPPSSYQPNPISTQFYSWLFGYKFDDTIVIFTFTTIYFLCDKKKVSLLQSLISPAFESVQTKVIVCPKGKSDDGFAILDKLINTTMVANSARLGENENRAFVIGSVLGECPRSQILGRCSLGMKGSRYQNVGINNGLESLFKVSDRDARVENLKKIQMQYLPEKIEHVLSSGEKLQVEAKNQVSEKMSVMKIEDSLEKSEKGSEKYLLVYEEEMEKDDQPRVYSMENSQESLEYSLISEEYDHDWVLVDE